MNISVKVEGTRNNLGATVNIDREKVFHGDWKIRHKEGMTEDLSFFGEGFQDVVLKRFEIANRIEELINDGLSSREAVAEVERELRKERDILLSRCDFEDISGEFEITL